MMGDSPIQNVSDTAFMVAAYRALESARPDALFRDPLAERLAGEEGKKIIAQLPNGIFLGGWTVVIRTGIIDRFIQSAVADGIDTVLSLGAGLDARPYRMELPASLRWIEVDYPTVIDLKESRLSGEKPRCVLERVRMDLSDAAARRAFLADTAARSVKALVLTEGVVPYLSETDAGSLADDLRGFGAFRYWIIDYFSPASYRYRRRSGMSRVMQKAPFLFEPQDYFGFFKNHGWRPKEIRYLAEEGEALHRPFPMPFLMKTWLRFISRLVPPERQKALTQFAGFVLFEPASR